MKKLINLLCDFSYSCSQRSFKIKKHELVHLQQLEGKWQEHLLVHATDERTNETETYKFYEAADDGYIMIMLNADQAYYFAQLSDVEEWLNPDGYQMEWSSSSIKIPINMPTWFLGKIRYQQPIDESTVGTRSEKFVKQKTVTEAYLVDAVSYTDAEARLYQEIAANTPDFEITNISRLKLAEIFVHENEQGILMGETWFMVKAMFITDDEKTSRQKKTPSLMLVNAENPKQAYERVELNLKTVLDPFEITDVNATTILDIFPYVDQVDQAVKPVSKAVKTFVDGMQKLSDEFGTTATISTKKRDGSTVSATFEPHPPG